MRSNSNIVCGIQNLKMAVEYFEDFQRQHSGSKGANLFKDYCRRVNWILNDLVTHPFLPDVVREGIKQEINSDIFAVPAITEKIALLSPEKREILEQVIETLLSGAELILEDKTNE